MLKNLNNPTKKNPIKTTKIWNKLLKTKKDGIRFVWVSGHNNISGNEITGEIPK
jgi:ribonuclease HI